MSFVKNVTSISSNPIKKLIRVIRIYAILFELDFVFSGMEGFQLQADSTVSLGTSMVVKNKDGKVMAEFADLFSEIGPVNVTRVSLVKAELTIRSFPPGIYTWSVRIWDKNSTNAIESLAELDVQL